MNEHDLINTIQDFNSIMPPELWGFLLYCVTTSIRKWFTIKKKPDSKSEYFYDKIHKRKEREMSFEWGSIKGSYKSREMETNRRSTSRPIPLDPSSINGSQERDIQK